MCILAFENLIEDSATTKYIQHVYGFYDIVPICCTFYCLILSDTRGNSQSASKVNVFWIETPNVVLTYNYSIYREGKVKLYIDMDAEEKQKFEPNIINSTVYIICLALQVSTFAVNYKVFIIF